MKNLLFGFSFVAILALAAPAHAVNSCGATLGTKQGQVNSLCKPASKTFCPNGGGTLSCAQLTALFNNARNCKAARVAVNKCFNPPDQGHKTAVATVGQDVVKCQREMQNKCAAERRANNKKK